MRASALLQIKKNYMCLSKAATSKQAPFKPIVAWMQYNDVGIIKNLLNVFLSDQIIAEYITYSHSYLFPCCRAFGLSQKRLSS